MAVLKCKMCGGDLEIQQGTTIAECEYCGTPQTIPSLDNEKKMLQFERAERLRKNCEFDKAAGVYETIVSEFTDEAEAYWGLVLCKYGIEYVDDPATKKKVPTCHRTSFDSVMDDKNFELTLENAQKEARKLYREEAKQIETIRQGIIEVSSKADPYDIFICYKETAEDGQRTIDSVLAQDIYDVLTQKGYKVFFSRISLEDKLGQEYEPYIFAALNSAKVMLAVGTDYEYYNAVWVKNEWSRFLKLMETDKEKHLIPCYKDIDAYDMPKEFSKLQGQDMSKIGAIQDLIRGMEKLLTVNKREAEKTDSKAMDALLEDKRERKAKEQKAKRKKLAIPVCIMTLILAVGILIFGNFVQNNEEYPLLEAFFDLLGLTGDEFFLTREILTFLGLNVASYALLCVSMGISIHKGFKHKLSYITLILSWLVLIGAFYYSAVQGISLGSYVPFTYKLILDISYVFVFVFTLIMNWSPKKLRFWIALVFYGVLAFGCNWILESNHQDMFTQYYEEAQAYMEQGAYEEAIASLKNAEKYIDEQSKSVKYKVTLAEYKETLAMAVEQEILSKAEPIAALGFYAVADRYIDEMLSDHHQKATDHLSNLQDEYRAMAEQNLAKTKELLAVEPTCSEEDLEKLYVTAESGDIDGMMEYLPQGGYGYMAMEVLYLSVGNGAWDGVSAEEIAAKIPAYVPLLDLALLEGGLTNIVQWVNQQ